MHAYSLIYLSSLFDISCYDVTFSPFTNLRYLFNYSDLFRRTTTEDFTKISTCLKLSDNFFVNNYLLSSVLLLIIALILTSCIFKVKCLKRVSCISISLPLKDSLVFHVLLMPLAFGYIYYYFVSSFVHFTESSHNGHTDWLSLFNQSFLILFISLVLFYQIKSNLDHQHYPL